MLLYILCIPTQTEMLAGTEVGCDDSSCHMFMLLVQVVCPDSDISSMVDLALKISDL